MKVLRCFLIVLSSMHVAYAAIDFGSALSGFIVSNNATLELGNAVLEHGKIVANNGTLSSINGPVTCTNVVIDTAVGDHVNSVLVDGVIDIGSTITLSDAQRLLVDGGLVDAAVVVDNSTQSSSIQGRGFFNDVITVTQDSSLVVNWASSLNANIVLEDGATLSLNNDLVFAPGTGPIVLDSQHEVQLDGNGHTLQLGGDEQSVVTIQGIVASDVMLELCGSVAIGDASISFLDADIRINGNGNQFEILNDGGLYNDGHSVSLTDVRLVVKNSAQFNGAGPWYLHNVTLSTATGDSILVDGACTNSSINMFYGAVSFANDSRVALNSSSVLRGNWTLGSDMYLNGRGYVLDLYDGTISLGAQFNIADTVFSGVVAASFDNTSNQSMFLSNVDWLSHSGCAVSINGLSWQPRGAECVISDVDSMQGDIFNCEEVWWYGAVIELRTDVELNALWVAGDGIDLVIDGKGRTLDLANGALAASNARLLLRNIVLTNVTSDSFLDYAGTIDFSNVIIKLSDDADFSLFETSFVISGPTKFVTGNHTFTTWHEVEGEEIIGSYIDGVTAYYDTLNLSDNNNVVGFGLVNNGRFLFVQGPYVGNIIITGGSGGGSVTHHLDNNEFLVAYDGVHDRTISFGGSVTYEGHDHTITFSPLPNPVLLFGDEASLEFRDAMLDGMRPEHFSSQSAWCGFSDKTYIRLQQNWNLDRQLYFGGGSNQYMVLDLNNHTIDMSHPSAELVLGGSTGTILRICNGSLINLSDYKLSASHNTTIIFENVVCSLADDATYSSGALRIEGQCSFAGKRATSFINTSSAGITLASSATLTINDGVTYYHNNNGTTNVVFSDRTSTLALLGGGFKYYPSAVAPLVFVDGSLIVDHAATLDVGAGGITLGNSTDDFHTDIRPSAVLNVLGTGTLTYLPVT